jgi:hypothetical protein
MGRIRGLARVLLVVKDHRGVGWRFTAHIVAGRICERHGGVRGLCDSEGVVTGGLSFSYSLGQCMPLQQHAHVTGRPTYQSSRFAACCL